MYKLLLCTRYLRTRYIALASVISVTLGVATMIVVNSVMAGFSTEMRERIHGILADMVVEAVSMDGFPDPDRVMRVIDSQAGKYIEAMSPTVEVYGMLTFQYAGGWITRPVTIIGIDPESKSKVGTLKEHLENYKPVLDEEGHIVEAPAKNPDEPPNWELPAPFMKYRRMRMQVARLSEDGQDDLPHGVIREPADDGQVDDDLLERIAAADSRHEKEDPAAPLPARAIIGHQLASFLYVDKETQKARTVMMIQPGDDVKLSTVSATRQPEPRYFNATVVDIYKSGMSEYDSNMVFVNIEELQRIRGMIDPASGTRSVTTIQIKLKNFADAKTVSDRLRAVFPSHVFQIRTWEQKQGPLLAAVDVESTILNVLLFMIIAVAGFGILAIFFMIVVEKTRDIGILKSLGASSRGVMSIFVSYGLSLGLVGSGVGVVVGLLFVQYINEIEKLLTRITGRKVFDETIYYFPSIPTRVHAATVLWVALGAVMIAILASILPARRAARLHPVQALRHE
jgi:lipoprotein-releasing system permease protein